MYADNYDLLLKITLPGGIIDSLRESFIVNKEINKETNN